MEGNIVLISFVVIMIGRRLIRGVIVCDFK